jgi:hypothetical protein
MHDKFCLCLSVGLLLVACGSGQAGVASESAIDLDPSVETANAATSSDPDDAEPEPEMDTRDSAGAPASDLPTLCDREFDTSETEEPATFSVVGDYAIMRGLIGSTTPGRVAELLAHNPDMQTIVIAYSPGSEDDEANLEAAWLLNEAGIFTCVPPNGEINSGGVDFFLAGTKRWLGEDSWVGVHGWAADDFTAADIAKDDPEHDRYLDYYDSIGVDEAFYWFTLEAAPADDIHNMTEAERELYRMAT